MHDLLIRHATLYDGSGADPIRADLAVRAGRIRAIAPSLPVEAKQVNDADGLALLPDIIDKPVGSLLFRDIFSNGRIFAHTLVFSLALGLLGLYRYRRGKGTGVLVLAFGSLMHLLLDSMWNTPQTLFWPLLGWDFPRVDLSNWLERLLYALRYNPFTFVPEIAGGLILAWFGLRLVMTRQVLPFLRYGILAPAAKPPSEPHGKKR